MPAARLPFIDEHATDVEASCERTWDALVVVVSRSFQGRGREAIARLLGASETVARGAPGEPGSTIAGFRVAAVDAPGLLVLEGEHRFSRYALVFQLDPQPGGGCRLRAETRAEFGGLHGRIYRAMVIGTRGHVVVVRRLLRAIRDRARA